MIEGLLTVKPDNDILIENLSEKFIPKVEVPYIAPIIDKKVDIFNDKDKELVNLKRIENQLNWWSQQNVKPSLKKIVYQDILSELTQSFARTKKGKRMIPQRKISNRITDLSKTTNLSKTTPNNLSWNSLDSILPEITKKKTKKKRKKKKYQKINIKFCEPLKSHIINKILLFILFFIYLHNTLYIQHIDIGYI